MTKYVLIEYGDSLYLRSPASGSDALTEAPVLRSITDIERARPSYL